MYLIPNRYKVLLVTSKHSAKIKQEVLWCLAENAFLKPLDRVGDIFRFKHSMKWWHNSYTVLICFDADNFYISVQSEALVSTHANGIMDFGGTEKFRKKIKSELEKIVSATPCSEEVSQAFSEPF
ncbi:MAG: hypothetical protein IPP73_07670 [Chitinophagaceae bacterium]|nr:hypothetical protein [Chitinophagaceae bacterium]